MTKLWGPIAPNDWAVVPCVVGRPATENDVSVGHAVFYVQGDSVPAEITIPSCAYQLLEDGSEEPVVVVQAEQTSQGVILGVRPLSGGNSVCMETEVRLLHGGFEP